MVKSPFSVIILAAGKGTRMNSPLPKVLHPVAGVSMVERVIRAAKGSGAQEVRVIVGYGESLVREQVEPLGAVCLKQSQQLGTADAVRAAQPESLQGVVVILNGDHPLIQSEDLSRFVSAFNDSSAHLSVVTCELDNPGAYGRIVRNKGEIYAIVELKDAVGETKQIREVNTGIYVIRAETLNDYLPRVKAENAQREYYLTDIVPLLISDGKRVEAIQAPERVACGVNTQGELASLTETLFAAKRQEVMAAGVTLIDPKSTYIEDLVTIGEGTVIFPNVYLRGQCEIGKMVAIESGSFIAHTKIGDGVRIKAGCYMERAVVSARSEIGPYAHLRPGTEIGEECKVGNFVEMKKVKFSRGAKASHLTYLGDAEVGENTNIGCGTITCNYAPDRKKYVTKIGRDVFVGSDTQFIAPIEIGDNAVIGSGSTITKDVPAKALAVARGRQVIKENYVKESSDGKSE